MTQGNKLVQWLVRWTEVLNGFFTIYFRTCFHSLKNRVGARVTELDHPVWFGFDNLLFMFDFVVILTFYISKFSFLSFMFDLVFYFTPLGLKISFWPSLSLSHIFFSCGTIFHLKAKQNKSLPKVVFGNSTRP